MAYIVSRNQRFYVVAYDGIDPATGKERRRWQPAGNNRADAEAIAANIVDAVRAPTSRAGIALTLGQFLTDTWLPDRQRRTRATTAYRYGWMIDRYITPAIGDYSLRSIRTDHLNDLYVTQRAADMTDDRSPQRLPTRSTSSSEARSLRQQRKGSLASTSPCRHDGRAHTHVHAADPRHGMSPNSQRSSTSPPATGCTPRSASPPRPECAEARSSDFAGATGTPISTGCRSVELGKPLPDDPPSSPPRREPAAAASTSTRPPRRFSTTGDHVKKGTGTTPAPAHPCSPNTAGDALHPESISQLFSRLVVRSGLPRIRFHDLRHTHASLLVADGVNIKVVSERLGHAHPSFTIHTYQHLVPGMSTHAAHRFAALIDR